LLDVLKTTIGLGFEGTPGEKLKQAVDSLDRQTDSILATLNSSRN